MSNDLISRSALLKTLEEKVYPEKYGEKCNALDVINGVLQVIGEHPSAYDVDKVVGRLEEKAIEELGIDKARFAMDKGEYSGYCSLTLEDAIEIVKSGGIE